MELIEIPTELNQGDQFSATVNDEFEIHEIIGFFTATQFVHIMYSMIVNHPDGLRYVNKWEHTGYNHVGESMYKLLTVSDYTICDMIAYFDKNKGL